MIFIRVMVVLLIIHNSVSETFPVGSTPTTQPVAGTSATQPPVETPPQPPTTGETTPSKLYSLNYLDNGYILLKFMQYLISS